MPQPLLKCPFRFEPGCLKNLGERTTRDYKKKNRSIWKNSEKKIDNKKTRRQAGMYKKGTRKVHTRNEQSKNKKTIRQVQRKNETITKEKRGIIEERTR